MHISGQVAGIASLLTIFGLGTAQAADVLVPPPAPAPAANTMTLKISGQVNRGVLWGDNGTDDEIFLVDNDNSGTRFRFVASGRLNDDITAGATIELQYESNSTTDIRFGANGGTGGTGLGGATPVSRGVGERIGEVWFNSASMGKISLGQGNTASNGTSEVDQSGTDIIGYSGVADMGSGLQFDIGAGLAGNPTIGSVFTNLDGGSRRDRIRYDTPTFAGFRASTSYAQGGFFDVALRYAVQFAGAKFAAAIAFSDNESNGGRERLNGSASLLLDNGLSLTVAGGRDDNGGVPNQSDFYYGKLGFTT